MRQAALVISITLAGCAGAGVSDSDDLARSPADFGTVDKAPPAGDLSTAAPPDLTGLTPQVTFIAVGQSFPITATFSDKNFGNQPLAVAFQSADSTIATVQSGQLPFNANQVQVMGAAIAVGDTTVSATFNGVTKSATVHVVPSVTALDPMPLKVQVGQTGTLTVTLSQAALPGGADIVLASADPKTVTVPSTVHIDQGMTQGTVTVTSVAQGGPVNVTASYDGSSKSAPVWSIDPVNRLAISEVMYDPVGMDVDTNGTGYEWVEIWNGSSQPVDLSGYFLAIPQSSTVSSYVALTPKLSGTLMPGDCKVVGGPGADPTRNALPSSFAFFVSGTFSPSLSNGTMAMSESVALFQGSSVGTGTIVDAVIYGNAVRTPTPIADETGLNGTLDVGYVQFAGQTLERIGPTAWRVQNKPSGGNCDWLHL